MRVGYRLAIAPRVCPTLAYHDADASSVALGGDTVPKVNKRRYGSCHIRAPSFMQTRWRGRYALKLADGGDSIHDDEGERMPALTPIVCAQGEGAQVGRHIDLSICRI